MKNFWKWMKKKEYDKWMCIVCETEHSMEGVRETQILIGYMIEYLICKDNMVYPLNHLLALSLDGELNIDRIHNNLKQKIEELG